MRVAAPTQSARASEPAVPAVGSSQYLPACVLAVVRLGLGVHLLVAGYRYLGAHFYPGYHPHLLATPLCGCSFVLLALCAALESVDAAPGPCVAEFAAVLHMVGAALALSSVAAAAVHFQARALAAVLMDVGLGSRLRFRPLHVLCPALVVLPQVVAQTPLAAVGDVIAIVAASALVYCLSHASDLAHPDDGVDDKTHCQPDPSTMYQAI